MTDRNSTQSGISLVEFMVGMMASVLVVGAALSMTAHHSKHRQVDEQRYLAMVACKNSLEELRSVPFSSLPGMHDTGFDVPAKDGSPGGLSAVEGDADGLPGRFTVTVDQSAGTEKVYLVRATATWAGAQRLQTLALETLMKERR